MLTEEEYLAIVEREERALLGDRSVVPQLIELDLPRLLAFVRELQRQHAPCAECGLPESTDGAFTHTHLSHPFTWQDNG